jgi:mRNA-degrading endonuclease RelE of RelBE toxin-antitoxin system
MDLIIEPEAEEDLNNIKEQHRAFIRERLQELKKKPINHPNADYVRVKGREVFKYVMKKDSKGGKDYRAIYDIRNGEINVAAIFHRDEG